MKWLYVLTRVSSWPAAKRIALARELLHTLSGDLGGAPASRKSLKDLLGLLRTEGPPPSDELVASRTTATLVGADSPSPNFQQEPDLVILTFCQVP
jgi:hypothetical protein